MLTGALQRKDSIYWMGQIVLAALALLLVWATCYREPILSRDGTFYAERILAKIGNGQAIYHDDFNKPPLFILGAYCIYRCSGCGVEMALWLLNALALAWSVFPMAHVGRSLLHSRAAALFCAAWLITSPLLLEDVRGGTREPLFICFGVFSLAFAFGSDTGSWRGRWETALSAVFGVFSALTRFEGLGFILFSFLIIVFKNRAGLSAARKALLGAVFVFVGGLTLLILAFASTEIRIFLLGWCAKLVKFKI